MDMQPINRTTQSLKEMAKKHPRAFRLFCLALLIIFALVLNLQPRINPLKYDLIDPSFNYGINEATVKNVNWGSGFIATYGPLGYLVSNYLPQNQSRIVVWTFFFCIMLGLAVWLFYGLYLRAFPKKQAIAGAILLVYALSMRPPTYIEWSWLALFLVYGFIYLKLKKHDNLVLFGMGAVAAIFIFIKFTIGIAAFVTLLLLPLAKWTRTKNVKSGAIGLTASIAAFCILTAILANTLGVPSLGSYVHNGLLMSAGFSSAMALLLPNSVDATYLFGACLILLLGWLVWRTGFKNSLAYAFILPSLFMIWKYGVVRQDGHLLNSIFVIFPILLIIYFLHYEAKRQSRQLTIGILLVGVLISAFWADAFIPFMDFKGGILSPVNNVKNHSFIAAFHFSSQGKKWQAQSAEGISSAKLPNGMRAEIGQSTVDIFPWEAVIVAANGLNWDPRPSPYSFETYVPSFDESNSNFFLSSRRPKFIIWHSTLPIFGLGDRSIDGRPILWDEPETLRTILANYNARSVDKGRGFVLLESKPQKFNQEAHKKIIKSQTLGWGKWVNVPALASPHSHLYVAGHYKRGIPLELEEELLRGEKLSISVETESGQVVDYRFVPDNLSQGFLIDHLPLNWDSLADYLVNKTGGEKIKRIRFNCSAFTSHHISNLNIQWLAVPYGD